MTSRKIPINPAGLVAPVGFAHAYLVVSDSAALRTLYLAGQCGYDPAGAIASPGDLAAQLDRAMANIGECLRAAEMQFADIVQLNFFVLSRNDYATARRAFGEIWRRHCGRHYPAMAMVMVAGLFDPLALIEIQGIASR